VVGWIDFEVGENNFNTKNALGYLQRCNSRS
jgi:hypothetical protein